MAKGNIAFGGLRGAVGEFVFSKRKGQQIVKARNRQPFNPKSQPQILQRARFVDGVKFYQKAVANFFQFAFEDKKPNETYFNAFMRHNVKNGVMLTPKAFYDENYPAVGRWLLTQGTLPGPYYWRFEDSGDYPAFVMFNRGPSKEAATTIGDFSKIMLRNSRYAIGDIITIVLIDAAGAIAFIEENPIISQAPPPSWEIRQFVVDPNSNITLESINLKYEFNGDGHGLTFDRMNQNQIMAIGAIQSRQTPRGLKVSTCKIINTEALEIEPLIWYEQDAWKDVVLQAWQASDLAVLEGSMTEQ